MSYEEGSMGVALLVGVLVFLGLNAVLGILIPFCLFGMCIPLGADGALMGVVPLGWSFLFAGIFTMQFIGALVVPIIVGILAGLIAKGSPTRGFIAGFVSNLIGYYIGFVILFAVFAASTPAVSYGYDDYGYGDYGYDSSITGLAAQGPMGPGMGAQPTGMMSGDILSWVLILLVIPMIVGFLGGICAAILSVIMAKPAASAPSQAPPQVYSTGQAAPGGYPPSPPQQPIAPQQQADPPSPQPSPQEKSTKKDVVVCPNCGKENKNASTFCDGCGSRIT